MTLLRVLVAHNAYQLPGGEDGVVAAEVDMLRSQGHEVETLFRSNIDIPVDNSAARMRAARDCIWSPTSAEAMHAAIRHFKPDVVHVHNTLAALSPSIYWAAAQCKVPVVQTLHNFRLACPQAMFLRQGRVCQDCLGRVPLPGVVHGCYRDSRAQTLAVAAMLVTHRALGTWANKVARYIVLSKFCRDIFVRAGIPERKICIKPNFARTPLAQVPVDKTRQKGHFLFVGRLSEEKGVAVLAQAMRLAPGLQCVVVGDGPAKATLEGIPGIAMTGWLDSAGVSLHMNCALALIVPSICLESFPLSPLEAFSYGVPVIASRIGSLPEIVEDGKTGMLCEPTDAADLRSKMQWILGHRDEVLSMGKAAHASYEARFSALHNYQQLIEIYSDASASCAV